MIDLYTTSTPNGHKVSCTLEAMELDYTTHAINLQKGDQKTPNFLAMNPNGRIPVIVDRENNDLAIFESGAIMIYLAEKTGKLLPKDLSKRSQVIQWLMFQMGGVGPMLGQAHHFRQYAPEKIPYAIQRYTNEASRLYCVLDKQLSQVEYIAGNYSIADIAIYPWIVSHKKQGQNLADFPHLKRWFETVGQRPAVSRGLAVLSESRVQNMNETARENLFGSRQFQQ